MSRLNLPAHLRRLPLAAVLLAFAAHAQSPLGTNYFQDSPPSPITCGLSSLENTEQLPPPSPSATGYSNDYAAGYSIGSGADLCPACNGCHSQGYYAFFGYDTWRGPPDDGWNNNGLHTGINLGTRLGPVSDLTGVGFQIGGSFGVYNWSGTDYHLSRNDMATPQGFVTYGFFRRPNENSNWSAAVVQDWMLNSNYGVFAENPTLSQWRAQLGYAINELHDFGMWGAFRGQGDTRNVSLMGPTRWESIQQLNAYWHYKWGASGPNTTVWFGVPEHYRLSGQGSIGDYTVGALTTCPLSDRVSLYALVTYMHPSASPGPPGSNDEAWCFFTGISFFPAKNARTRSIGGECWMPLMPIANNGYFLVDQEPTY